LPPNGMRRRLSQLPRGTSFCPLHHEDCITRLSAAQASFAKA
jgi:hypothetical protein